VDSIQGGIVNVRFSILDRGIGLSAEDQQRLFQPFVQADGSISRKYGGTGLGLSISKRLVELMGGSISVQSNKDTGSTFSFVVPLEFRSDSQIVRIKDELHDVRVLVVDDEQHSREITHNYVVSWGMRNGSASSADQGIQMLRQAYAEGDPYKIAVIDLLMPDKSGTDMAKEIFNDPTLSSTRLILLTAFDTPGLGTQAMELGFKAYVTKPVRQSQMLDCLVNVVRGGRPIISKSAADRRLANTTVNRQVRNELILVVEDNQINQQVAQLYLDELGFPCRIVSNGKEALEATKEGQYALILMDCQMPEMDGLTATEILRERERLAGCHVPVIALTASAMQGDKEKCIAAGMDDYLSKPIDPTQLRNMLDKWLPTQSVNEPGSDSCEMSQKPSEKEPALPADMEKIKLRYAESAARFVQMFVVEAPQDLENLKLAMNAKNASKVLECAHSLNGTCGGVFASTMCQLCVDMESAGLANDWPALSALVDKLEKELERVLKFLAPVLI
jgi:two-component system sensor histidine kinase/response regulator